MHTERSLSVTVSFTLATDETTVVYFNFEDGGRKWSRKFTRELLLEARCGGPRRTERGYTKSVSPAVGIPGQRVPWNTLLSAIVPVENTRKQNHVCGMELLVSSHDCWQLSHSSEKPSC